MLRLLVLLSLVSLTASEPMPVQPTFLPEAYAPLDLSQQNSYTLVGKVRNAVLAKGGDSMAAMWKTFQDYDPKKRGIISFENFQAALSQQNLGLSPSDIIQLSKVYDAEHDGNPSYENLMKEVQLRGSLIMDGPGGGVITPAPDKLA